ncbi:MAG: hypothetical protein RI920_1355 [Pseudomonadota bacterium]|jgi:uncharacterized protein (DUF779 family)
MIHRVIATDAALALVEALKARHGEVFFYQSGGCCEGSTPMCLVPGDLTLMADDVRLGDIAGVSFHVSRSQCEYLMGSQLTIDVAPGSLGTFSLEDADGHHFVTRTRVWTDAEWHALEAQERLSGQVG